MKKRPPPQHEVKVTGTFLGKKATTRTVEKKEFKKQNKGEKETPQDLAIGNEKRTNR